MTAATLYDAASAERYRRHDDALAAHPPSQALAAWLGDVSAACGENLTVVDLGCGTGRYFWALRNVAALLGVDASPAMLAQAKRPYRADRVRIPRIMLIEADLLHCAFAPARVDLVYAIGVLAEHAQLTEGLVADVASWLRPGGRFAFTTVRPDSPSVPQTIPRRVAGWMAPLVPGAPGRAIRRRLLSDGHYADEPRVRELLARRFAIESIEPFTSEAHLHCRVVARRLDA
jgi:SAM-dependent methyltransferase